MKTFLHVGCGPQVKSDLRGFNNSSWKEIRFDIDENNNPDIVGTLTDMSLVETGSVDAIYSAHNIEHVYPHEVPIVLSEFYSIIQTRTPSEFLNLCHGFSCDILTGFPQLGKV